MTSSFHMNSIKQLPKNVILVNKLAQGSVIHSTDSSDANIHPLQLISSRSDENDIVLPSHHYVEDESRRRREVLARRPSYRKILNELSSSETVSAITTIPTEVKSEEDSDNQGTATITVAGTPYLKVLSTPTIQLAASQDGTLQGIQTLTMTNPSAGSTPTIVQYATQGSDGQFFVPVTVSAADLQTYQIRQSTGSQGIAQSVVVAAPNLSPQHPHMAEEVTKKRELRLLKNREAAKECRRKKKEYIKCLENRVAVLENQNKALIEELKSLKELYCQKTD